MNFILKNQTELFIEKKDPNIVASSVLPLPIFPLINNVILGESPIFAKGVISSDKIGKANIV